ncbi:hypothetical protein ncot_12130 [Nocardioides sp. JQ2195]|uniref:hypothetical protein n=1 Tax=Nocardioides sp. JQ2195 TaxID=2592334 RepID=UPI00143EC8C6|nr:hypothetical protein [Nocardioides sp. JQ2195]QIX27263.1 hypothetical protein ncot_12130 [Nocardioides sp. JQ2195]
MDDPSRMDPDRHPHVDPDHAADLKGQMLRNRDRFGISALFLTLVGLLVVLLIFWLIVQWQR